MNEYPLAGTTRFGGKGTDLFIPKTYLNATSTRPQLLDHSHHAYSSRLQGLMSLWWMEVGKGGGSNMEEEEKHCILSPYVKAAIGKSGRVGVAWRKQETGLPCAIMINYSIS